MSGLLTPAVVSPERHSAGAVATQRPQHAPPAVPLACGCKRRCHFPTGLVVAAASAAVVARQARPGLCRRVGRRRALTCRRAYEILPVPVRGGSSSVGLKRFLADVGGLRSIPRMLPAILLLHDGPGLPSQYLEPLAVRLCVGGRAVYVYDQLGCGLSRNAAATELTSEEVQDVDLLQSSISDFRDVLCFLSSCLGEPQVHLVGHGYGGAMLMEAMLRKGLYQTGAAKSDFPTLRSICLLGVASSTMVLCSEARRLMRQTETALSKTSEDAEDVARSFWLRHICGLKPQPACLTDAYSEAFPGLGGQRWGPLAGWFWYVGSTSQGATVGGQWELRKSATLQSWQLERSEVAAMYWEATGGAPLLSIRGQHDFVTDACVEAWRGVSDAAKAYGGVVDKTFSEVVIGACGHNAHLEDPELVAAKLRLWLLRTDELDHPPKSKGASASRVEDELQEDRMELDGCVRILSRMEARQKLTEWSSALSWAAYARSRSNLTSGITASRFTDQGFAGTGVASHLDGRTSSREARRLAEWAWELPAAPASDSLSVEFVTQALRECTGEGCEVDTSRQVAVGLSSHDGSTLLAIACVEAMDMSKLEAEESGWPSRCLDIVGAAASPGCSRDVKDGFVRSLRRLIADVDRAGGPQ
mmetsp:Transcript_100902/g.261139  ORF Transcript_100902/g.261139 Transcript_100902/m.261139 type:complete len:644 (-) Transcript_100902:182-2113(-)